MTPSKSTRRPFGGAPSSNKSGKSKNRNARSQSKGAKASKETAGRNARYHATRSSPTYTQEAPAGRREAILAAFDKLWEALFTGPVHLDSALSKQKPYHKSALAQMIQGILLRPVSLAESMGVGVGPGEPWALSHTENLARWRPAALLAARLYDAMSGKISAPSPVKDDFPPAMIAEWERAFGAETAAYLVEALATEPPLGIRAARKTGAETLLQELTQGSRLPVRARVSDLSPLGVRLDGYARVMDSALFESGGFEIQDEGSQIMALFALWPEVYGKLLTEKPGEARAPGGVMPVPANTPVTTVVDACAGAGGKTLAFADLLGNKGRVFAYDTSERKLQALRRRAKRAGYNTIQTVALPDDDSADAKVAEFKKPADLVLVDAPCSGWGVLRRNPDIKWRQSDETLRRMPEIQLRLLTRYSRLVRKGGRLVFGVCTFRPEETRDVVEKFIKANPEFRALEGGYLGPGPTDGFFMQRFVRN